MSTKPVPAWLIAAWERIYIIDGPGGPPDYSVNVRNIQTPTLFGDVRIPKDRPAYPGIQSLSDLSDKDLRTLYSQEGFSGFTTVEGYITTWHHEIDYQPPDGSVDVGRIELRGGRNMFEHGVQASYLEHWWNLSQSDGWCLGIRVLRRQTDGSDRVHEILSVSGDHFIYARNRAQDLPMADSLTELIQSTHATREQILQYLDCEVSHGFLLGGSKPWEIQYSTLPFRTGCALEFVQRLAVETSTGRLVPRSAAPGETWSFEIDTLNVEDLLILFPSVRP